MLNSLFSLLLLCSVVLAGGASSAATKYPATFQSGDIFISTMEQFDQRNRELHPNLQVTKSDVESVEWKNQSYKGLHLLVEGVESERKIVQNLTYFEILPGLWRLLLVNVKVCLQSTILENKVEVTKWFCEDDMFPISGFQDLYIAKDANVDLELLQTLFKKPLVPYEKDKPGQPQEVELMTLADLEKALAAVGSTMTVKETQYVPILQPDQEPKPGLIISVRGQLDSEKSVDQNFKYVIESDKLKMKEIDGKICWFAPSLSKQICESVYVPTPVSSLPLVLINSYELTGATPAEKKPNPLGKVAQVQQCGLLQSHLGTILKVHFQRSMFDVDSPVEFQRFIDNFPKTADPMALMLNQDEQKRSLDYFVSQSEYQGKLNRLILEFAKGGQGDCGFLFGFMETLKELILPKTAQVFQLINVVKDNDFVLENINTQNLTPYQKEVLARLPSLSHPVLRSIDSKAALDVALAIMKTYMQKSLDRLSQLETFTLAAMAAQDDYSTLIPMQGEVAGAILGHQEKKYFGLSIETGLSGKHYVTRLHSAAQQQGLEIGDEVILINEQKAQGLPYADVDKILLAEDQPIALVLRRGEQEKSVILRASALNPLSFYYSLRLDEEEGSKLLNIQISSFEPGIAEAIYKGVQKILAENVVDGFVLDLRDNPGGNTDEAVNVLSFFAKDRVVTLSKLGARDVSPIRAYQAKPEFFIDDQKPLLVLVNHKTMSSSEIVASGYQALKRSVTVGEPTHGKLVGQFFIPATLSDMSNYGLLITAFEFFTVDGKALNGIGVMPDVLMSQEKFSAEDGGVGLGKDIPTKDLPVVELYDFSMQDWEDLGIAL